MQSQAQVAANLPSIDADIIDICENMPPVYMTQGHTAGPAHGTWWHPNGPWQEIIADYFIHKGKEYLLICDLFSKYPFIYMTTAKTEHSITQRIQDLICQCGPPRRIYTTNGPPFTWEDFVWFVQQQLIEHTCPPCLNHFNGFIGWQFKTAKTILNTTQAAGTPLNTLQESHT